MANPSYVGGGQSSGRSTSWFGRLSSYFGGGGTPAYQGEGQPTSTGNGFLFGVGTPAYLTPSAKPADSQPCETEALPSEACAGGEAAAVMCPIDPQALADGKIAIVIPRQGT
jgi:hypothetical protein